MLTPALTYKVALTESGGLSVIEQTGSAQPGRVWDSLQQLIDDAPITSRIELGAGTYRERLYINKAIQLVAANAPGQFDARSALEDPGFSVVFDGTNASEVWNGGQSMIQIEDVRMLTGMDRFTGKRDSFQVLINGIEFRNNGSLDVQGQGGAITVNRSDATITNNYFHDLKSHDGAALLLLNDAAARVVNNLFWDNAATRWGAAIMDTQNDDKSNFYAANSFRTNTSKEGPALYQDFGRGYFLDNTIDANNSYGSFLPVDSTPLEESKGAVMLRKDSEIAIVLNRFTSNTVSSAVQPNSGALNIETEGSTNQVFLNLFSGNSVDKSIDPNDPTGRGGAIGIFNQSRPDIAFNLFVDNTAGYGGSAIGSAEWAVPTIRSNLFLNNSVPSDDSIDNPRMGAGAVFFEGTGSETGSAQFEQARVYSNYFQGNSAPAVADLFVGDQAGVDAQYNTFSAGRIATSDESPELSKKSLAVLISNSTNDETLLANNTYVGPSPSQDSTWILNNAPNGDLSMQGESFAVNDILTAYNDANSVPAAIDSGTSRLSPLAQATQGSSSFPLGSAALADPSLQNRSSEVLLQQDFQGYDRRITTVDGATETNPRSEVQEMDTVVWRFSKPGQPVHFYTASEAEKDLVIANGQKQVDAGRTADWVLDGPATNFNVSRDPLINYGNGSIDMKLSPVYRLFNTISGTHLYTMDSEELYSIVTNLPNYNFEGIAFYALSNSGDNPSGTATLQRFLNKETGSHFYTADPNEFASVSENLDSLNFGYDGPSFLAAQVADPIA